MARSSPTTFSRLAVVVSILMIIPIVGLAAALLAAPVFWVGDILTFFLPWIAVAVGLTLVFAAVVRLRLVALATIGLGVVVALPMISAWSHPPELTAGTPLRVTTFNTLVGTADPDAVMLFLGQESPDILVLQEYSGQMESELAARFRAMFPYRSDVGSEAVPTLLLLSRYPIVDSAVIASNFDRFGHEDQSVIRTTINVDERSVVVYAVHAPTPRWGDSSWQARNALLDELAANAAGEASGSPVIIAGDFNTPPWSPHFLQMLADGGGLADTAGRLFPSPTRIIDRGGLQDLLGAPVDHILVSNGIGWRADQVGPDLGSDHRPVTADLVLPD